MSDEESGDTDSVHEMLPEDRTKIQIKRVQTTKLGEIP